MNKNIIKNTDISALHEQDGGPVIAVRMLNSSYRRSARDTLDQAVSSWSWAGMRGSRAEVEIYSEQFQVELLLNGKSLGRKKLKEGKATFITRYIPGVITAIVYDGSGREMGKSGLCSAEAPVRLAIKPEKNEAASGEVLRVCLAIEGANGIIESNMDRELTLSIENGELMEQRNPIMSCRGRAEVIVRAETSGSVKLKVTDGSLTAETILPVRKES